MPVEFSRDDARRRVRVTLRGDVSLTAMKAIVDRQVVEGAWTYTLLYDTRGLTREVSPADAEELLEHVRKVIAERGPRGAVAVVARTVSAIATAENYAMKAGTGLRIEVFWDMDEAERWLDEPHK